MAFQLTAKSVENGSHKWRFFRAGGVDQARLDSGAELAALDQLDQKLWVALSCPVKGLEFDEKTLALIDTDKDGRVRVPEVIAAVKWILARIKDPNELVRESSAMPLASIEDNSPQGKQLLSSATQILQNLGKPKAASLTIEDVSDPAKIFGQSQFNGDGIITAESAPSDALKQAIADILSTHGSEIDRSGKPGVSQAKIDAFFKDAAAFDAWNKQSEENAQAILPLGGGTAAAMGALNGVRAKIDDYFARCSLAAFDSRAMAALNRPETEYLLVAAKDFSANAAELAGFPLARIEPGKPLGLQAGLNPAWVSAMAAFSSAVIRPLLGEAQTALTVEEWNALKAKFAPHESWLAGKAGASVEKLGLSRVRELLSVKALEDLTALVARDKSLEAEAAAIADVERLVRYYCNLHQLLLNFVSFEDFYSRRRKSLFQAGTLYLDARACDLCVRVDDSGKHAALAGLAKTYLAYCECTRVASREKMTIAAAFTGGDSDNLMVGRNGVFYDRKGRDWDATIVKVIENPISIRQAFWAPYKKFVRMIEEQVAKRAAAAEQTAESQLASTAQVVAVGGKGKPAEVKKIDVGTVAALGVAFGAIGTAFATIASYLVGLLKLPFWQVCIAVAGLLLLLSGPSMLIAWLKLRQRNLGPILDANGWAVNARVHMNVSFGGSLTSVAKLPATSIVPLDDPFGENPSVWPRLAAMAIAICFIFSFLDSNGFIHAWTGGRHGTRKAVQQSETNSVPGVAAAPKLETNAPAAK
jgi:hypothetical protein